MAQISRQGINGHDDARGTYKIVRADGYCREIVAGVTEQEAWREAYWYFKSSLFWGVPVLYTPIRIV